MADLIHAAETRLKYAGNELASGDKDAALGHLLKAQEFIGRVVAPLAPSTDADDDIDEPLSPDQPVAFGQILSAMGLTLTPSEGGGIVAPSAGALLGAASPEQNAQLTLMGLFGTPDDQATFPTADFSLFNQYHERANDGGWAPKPDYANTGAWAAYAATL